MKLTSTESISINNELIAHALTAVTSVFCCHILCVQYCRVHLNIN